MSQSGTTTTSAPPLHRRRCFLCGSSDVRPEAASRGILGPGDIIVFCDRCWAVQETENEKDDEEKPKGNHVDTDTDTKEADSQDSDFDYREFVDRLTQ